jgi:hypothetical protein
LKTPKIQDEGIANIDLSTGQGINVKMVWHLETPTGPGASTSTISLAEVKCSIERVNIAIIQSKHQILDKVATSLFSSKIKKTITREVVNTIMSKVKPVNDALNDFFASRPINHFLEKANTQLGVVYTKASDKISEKNTAKYTFGEPLQSNLVPLPLVGVQSNVVQAPLVQPNIMDSVQSNVGVTPVQPMIQPFMQPKVVQFSQTETVQTYDRNSATVMPKLVN